VVVVLLLGRQAGAVGAFLTTGGPGVELLAVDAVVIAAEGVVTLHLRPTVSGVSGEVAWVLPIPEDHPEAVAEPGSEALFEVLAAGTEPLPALYDRRYVSECLQPPDDCRDRAGHGAEGEAPGEGEGEGEGEGPGPAWFDAERLFQPGRAGPDEWVVPEAQTAGDLLDWLEGEGFVVTQAQADRLAEHGPASDFVVARLRPGEAGAELQPLVLRTRAAAPSLPLRLAAPAARPDVPLRVWVVGNGRAVPVGWRHVVPHPARFPWHECDAGWFYVDWHQPRLRGCPEAWLELAAAASRAADGPALATGSVVEASVVAESLPDADVLDVSGLRDEHDPARFLEGLKARRFPGDSRLRDLLRRRIPLPPSLAERGVSETAFYGCLDCYRTELREAGFVFDPEALVEALESEIIEPLDELKGVLRALEEVTFLYGVLGGAEVQADPVFDVAHGRAPVPRKWDALLTVECSPDVLEEDALRGLSLADGTAFWAGATPGAWRDAFPDDSLPPALRVEEWAAGATEPDPVADHRAELEAHVEALRAEAGEPRRHDVTTMSCDDACCRVADPCQWGGNGLCDCRGRVDWEDDPAECGPMPCEPGTEVACACDEWWAGILRCTDEGTWSECDCDGGFEDERSPAGCRGCPLAMATQAPSGGPALPVLALALALLARRRRTPG